MDPRSPKRKRDADSDSDGDDDPKPLDPQAKQRMREYVASGHSEFLDSMMEREHRRQVEEGDLEHDDNPEFKAKVGKWHEKEDREKAKARREAEKEDQRREKEAAKARKRNEKVFEKTPEGAKRSAVAEECGRHPITRVIRERRDLLRLHKQQVDMLAQRIPSKTNNEKLKWEMIRGIEAKKKKYEADLAAHREKYPEADEWLRQHDALLDKHPSLRLALVNKWLKPDDKRFSGASAAPQGTPTSAAPAPAPAPAQAPIVAPPAVATARAIPKVKSEDDDKWTLETVFLAHFAHRVVHIPGRMAATAVHEEYMTWAKACGYADYNKNKKGSESFTRVVERACKLERARDGKPVIWKMAKAFELPFPPLYYKGRCTDPRRPHLASMDMDADVSGDDDKKAKGKTVQVGDVKDPKDRQMDQRAESMDVSMIKGTDVPETPPGESKKVAAKEVDKEEAAAQAVVQELEETEKKARLARAEKSFREFGHNDDDAPKDETPEQFEDRLKKNLADLSRKIDEENNAKAEAKKIAEGKKKKGAKSGKA